MPVRHVLAKTNVPHQNDVSNFALDGSRRLLDNALIRPGTRGDFIFFLGQPKENYRRYAQRPKFFAFAQAAKTRYRERHILILAKGARGSSLKWPCTAAAGQEGPGNGNDRPELVLQNRRV